MAGGGTFLERERTWGKGRQRKTGTPVQAKGHKDKLSVVQVRQDLALCVRNFPRLVCRPIGAQLMGDGLIAVFELQETEGRVRIALEKHYRLVSPDEMTSDDLDAYRTVSRDQE